jgi:DNA topoisomerase-3
MKLVLAEKPSVAAEIARVLGATARHPDHYAGDVWHVTWALGHLLQIAEPEDMDPAWAKWLAETLPMVPATWRYSPRSGVAKQLSAVSKMLRSAELVLAATDADREGEHIFRLIYDYSRSRAPVRRLWLSSLTDEAIREAFADLRPGEEFDSLAAAASARAHADWLVGLNCTRAYTLLNGTKCSIGRVQTPTLALVVRRQHEIDVFKPVPYAEIHVTLEPGFRARLLHGGKPRLEDLAQARAILQEIAPLPSATVTAVETKDIRTPPPRLFNLLALQQEANQRFGMTAARTLQIAQELYEAKALTYPRTDSGFLSTKLVPQLPAHIAALGTAYPEAAAAAAASLEKGLGLGKDYVNDAKVTAHHAIIPTTDPASWNLSPQHRSVYDLVARRFLAIFLPPKVSDATVATFSLGPHTLRATGSLLKSPGWSVLEKPASPGTQQPDDEPEHEEQPLPPLQVGQAVKKLAERLVEKKTSAPKPMTDASLLQEMKTAGRLIEDSSLAAYMKENGLGTPATRGAIIERLLDVGYLERRKKTLAPTAKGLALVAQAHPSLCDPVLTAHWEEQLAAIEDGKLSPKALEEDVASWVRSLVPSILRSKPMSEDAAQETFGKCPKCKTGLVRKTPKGWGCSAYKETSCSFVVWAETFGHKVSEAELRQLLADGITKKPLKLARKDGSGSYEAQLRLSDEFRVVPALQDAAHAESFGACPLCKKGAVIATPKGWGCNRYKEADCKLVIWSEIAGHKLTPTEVRELVANGRTTNETSFSSKAGKAFKARIRLDESSRAVLAFDGNKDAPEAHPPSAA